ncbi:MAG: 16S rRNA (guanine(527)-N(7))-methyltransferase RsmG [Chloroflexi bacterium]|nr:16S rRNA (guanine(527)-N(7))-methyltransferase RsmG [Chloroflexota bacterium]
MRDLLLEWNRRTNLTAVRTPEGVEEVHFVDSLACLLAPIPASVQVLDVGAGAGFPGLALKLARPDLSVTLLEATGKKARFMEHAVAELGLAGVDVVAERAELARHLLARFDVVVARAVASLAALLELTLPFATPGGLVVLPKKGPGLAAEIDRAGNALRILGGEMLPPVDYDLGAERRRLLLIRKIHETPSSYPRRPGMPVKNPL